MIFILNYKPRIVPRDWEMNIVDCALRAYPEYGYALDQLSPDEMSHSDLARIFGAAKKLHAAGRDVDLVSVYDALGQDNVAFDLCTQIAGSSVTFVNMEPLILRVKDEARRNRINVKALEVIQGVEGDPILAFERIIQEERAGVIVRQSPLDKYHAYVEGLRKPLDETRLQTGFTKLDKTIKRLPLGSVSCVGARPSVGKTAFAVNVAHRQRKAGRNVLLASLEMSEEQINDRMTAMVSGVSYEDIGEHSLTDAQYEMVQDAEEIMRDYPGALEIRDKLYSIDAILAEAARVRPHLLIIDFLQYVKGPGVSDREVMDGAVRRCKEAARLYNMHIMICSQLNREAESDKENEDKPRRPRLKHLKGCGGIEEGSDIVILLHRPNGTSKPDIEFIVAKNKFGKVGIIKGNFDGDLQRITEVTDGRAA